MQSILLIFQYSVLYKKSSKKGKKKKDKLSDDEDEDDKKHDDCDEEKKSSESETDEKVPEAENLEHDSTLLDTESGQFENPKQLILHHYIMINSIDLKFKKLLGH